jgi:predicted nuclease with TOPRIM domain
LHFKNPHCFCFTNSDALNEKQAETAELANEYKRVDIEYNTKKDKLKDLLKEAERVAPSAEWKDRLSQDDIPSTLEDLDNEIDEAELKVRDFEVTLHIASGHRHSNSFHHTG